VLKEIISNYNAGNVDAAISYYAEDFMIMAPDGISIGKVEAGKAWKNFITTNTDKVTMDIYDDDQASGNLAFVRGNIKKETTPKTDVETQIKNEKILLVFLRQGDSTWKIIIEIWNNN
jgi:ketosteroid isomerase-like protein